MFDKDKWRIVTLLQHARLHLGDDADVAACDTLDSLSHDLADGAGWPHRRWCMCKQCLKEK